MVPDSVLVRALEAARATYPGVALEGGAFAAHVCEKLADLGAGANETSLRMTDLFLARAAAEGDRAAILYLERDTFGEVEAAYRRFPSCPVSLDDVKQRLREKLLLGRDAARPQILGYAGTGALRGWVRAAALHLLLNIVQRESREQPTDEELFDVIIGDEPSAETAYLKLACREELEAALSFAMSVLSDREKSLLRHAFVDRRNVDEIGAIYGVHRATAARWIAAARKLLVDHTRTDLVRRLSISDAEAKSIIAAALSGVGSMLIAKLGPSTRSDA
jgi:RNA polymerase sigma-70 factor, ECF subfamily